MIKGIATETTSALIMIILFSLIGTYTIINFFMVKKIVRHYSCNSCHHKWLLQEDENFLRDFPNCPNCNTGTPIVIVKYFEKLVRNDTNKLNEVSKPDGAWGPILIGAGLIFFGLGYLINVGFEGVYIFAIGSLIAGTGMVWNNIMQILDFRNKEKYLVTIKSYVCPECKHEWEYKDVAAETN